MQKISSDTMAELENGWTPAIAALNLNTDDIYADLNDDLLLNATMPDSYPHCQGW